RHRGPDEEEDPNGVPDVRADQAGRGAEAVPDESVPDRDGAGSIPVRVADGGWIVDEANELPEGVRRLRVGGPIVHEREVADRETRRHDEQRETGDEDEGEAGERAGAELQTRKPGLDPQGSRRRPGARVGLHDFEAAAAPPRPAPTTRRVAAAKRKRRRGIDPWLSWPARIQSASGASHSALSRRR